MDGWMGLAREGEGEKGRKEERNEGRNGGSGSVRGISSRST